MTQATSIITSAFREANITPIGQTPTSAEQTEGLDRLNTIVSSVFGHEMGEELSDWLAPVPQRTAPVAANFPQLPFPQSINPEFVDFPSAADADIDVWMYPPKNSRIVFGGITTKVFFPEQPDDGSRMAIVQGSGAGDGGMSGQTLTLDGNGRTIETSNTKTYTDPITARAWLYNADAADWQAVATLGLTDQMPFSSAVDDYFICYLAIRLCPRFSKPVSQETKDAFAAALKRFKARYRQAGTTVYGATDFPRSLQSYIAGRLFY